MSLKDCKIGSHPDTAEGDAWRVATALGVLGVNAVFVVVLFAVVHLREMPEFWTHAGGYPVLLREAVFFGFYPLLALAWVLVVGSAMALLRSREVVGRLVLAGLVVAILQVLGLALVLILMFR